MADITVYHAGIAGPATYAEMYLKESGIFITDHPTPEITHLLLDVPSRDIPAGLLERLPEDICIVGGNLTRPELEGYRKLDLPDLSGGQLPQTARDRRSQLPGHGANLSDGRRHLCRYLCGYHRGRDLRHQCHV